MSAVNPRFLLSRMEAAHRETSRHLALMRRQIDARAERITATEKARAKGRANRQTGPRWTRSDEMLFREHRDRLEFERRFEIDALIRKIARQDRAIAALRLKLGHEATLEPAA